MPDLPARPDLDQLRHQAKDLLRAAQSRDPAAIGRINAVSGPVMLSAAQLAIAREYGFASWARLKLEVERRDILNSRDLSRLTRLLAEHPEMATEKMQHWADRQCGEPLGYVMMLRFNHDRLGLPADLPGTGAIARALIGAGAPVNGRPGDKETPLITAASVGDADVVRALIEAGADLDAASAPDSGGVPGGTALDHAAVFGMTDVLDVLVAAGASIGSLEMAAAAGDVTGWPLGRQTLQSRLRALVFAAQYQRLEVIDQLVAAGTPVNEPDAEWGRLPLHTAAGDGQAASVRRLLAHGADPGLRDPLRGRTALEECQLPNRAPDSPAHDEVEAILRTVIARDSARPPGQDPARIQVTIVGSGLPGRDIGPGGNFPGARNIHVGVQRKDRPAELLGLTPGNAPSAHWDFEATATPAGGGIDIKGPYIQGRPGARFIYLSWGTVSDDGTFTMFRRAKLMLDAIDPATLDAARRYGALIARLELTDTSGHPLCAAVRPPLIRWSAAPTG
jgi:ankyrin repeat protein